MTNACTCPACGGPKSDPQGSACAWCGAGLPGQALPALQRAVAQAWVTPNEARAVYRVQQPAPTMKMQDEWYRK